MCKSYNLKITQQKIIQLAICEPCSSAVSKISDTLLTIDDSLLNITKEEIQISQAKFE